MKFHWRFYVCFVYLTISAAARADSIPTGQLFLENIPVRGIVFDILQDSRGFLWLGTEYGLVRYDGYEFTHFEHEPGNPHSLAGNAVKRIVEAPDGKLWIGTMQSGIHRFDPKTNEFKRYLHNPQDVGTISNNRINDLCLDNSGNLWIGTDGGGLDKMDLRTEKIYHYYDQGGRDDLGSYGRYIYDIQYTHQGELWIGGYKSLDLYHVEEDTFTHFQEAFLQDTIKHVINTIEEIGNGLLIGTRGGQLFRFDAEDKKFERWNLPENSGNNEGGNSIWDIHHDGEGRIWIGRKNRLIVFPSLSALNNDENYQIIHVDPMYRVYNISQSSDGIIWAGINNGLQKISVQSKKLQHHRIEIVRGNKVLHPGVTSLAAFEKDHIWLGTTRGLFLFDRKNNRISEERLKAAGLQQLLGKDIVTLYHDTSGNLWISTIIDFNRGFGVYCLNLKSWELIDFTNRCKPFYYNATFTVAEDANGDIWLGNGSGLIQYTIDSDTFTVFKNDANDSSSIPDNSVYKIFCDSRNRLWIGFNQAGVVRYDPANKRFTRIYKNSFTSPPESFARVRDIAEDHKGNIWIGTNDGLHCLHDDSTAVITFTKQQGLPDNTLSSILIDGKDQVWVGTHYGFARLNPATNTFNVYTYKEGMQHTEYWDRSSLLDENGYMYFGGQQGINYFHPDSVLENATFPLVYITGFSLFNKVLKPNDSSELLYQEMSYTTSIRLKYNQNVFSIRYAALNFQFPEKIRFAYQMEGFDREWQYVGGKREVTYTNLDPGRYTFSVRASNENGDWNERSATLKLIIEVPWWQSWWAYSLYGLLAIGVLIALRRYEIKQIKLKQKSMHLIELDILKSRFFDNISHEFRTPITLIQGPAQHILRESPEEPMQHNAKIILRNASHLLNLVNQLLDISKLEAGKMRLQAQKTDLVALIRHAVSSYDSLIADKKIKYEFRSESPQLMVYADEDKIEKVFHNLLSNAFKFTPDEGEVMVRLKTNDEKWVLISVSDSGIGIPADLLDQVFNRFYQADNAYTRSQAGSGLGMTVVKELVELHHGNITIESKEGIGSTFVVSLPLGHAHLSQDEIIDPSGIDKIRPVPLNGVMNDGYVSGLPVHENTDAKQEDAPILLIVEDNPDMRDYIRRTLDHQYQIEEAIDGKEGLSKTQDILPDLVISDIIMPEMDGFRMCELIKSQELTAHIPVILLTAKADRQSKLSGLELGADDYLPKPFDAEELQLIIRNRIEERRKIRERLSRDISFGLHSTSFTSLDEKFLTNVIGIMEQNLDDEKFTVEILSDEAGLSRVQLYRKIKAITNQSPNTLLRTLRLKRSAEMLRSKSDTVSQIAYSVGFGSLSYFNKCFKEKFGLTPTQYGQANGNK